MGRGDKRTPDIPVTESFVVHSSNGGRTWEKQLTDQGHFFFNVYFINPEVGWVCGADGLILKTIDGGGRWTRQPTPTDSDLVDIQFADSDRGWALGEDGEVLRTINGGLRWSSHRFNANPWVYFLNFSNKYQGWIVGENNQAYRSTDGGLSWRSRGMELVHLLDKRQRHEADFRAVKFVNPKVGFIAAVVRPKKEFERGNNVFRKGVIFRTEDGGRTWAVFFQKNGLELLSAEFITLDEVWVVHMHDDGLLATRDGGKTWFSQPRLPSPGVSHVYFADSSNGWAKTGVGWLAHLFYTNDGGKTWTESRLLDK